MKSNIRPLTVITGCIAISLAVFAGIAYSEQTKTEEGVTVLPETAVVAPKINCLEIYSLAQATMDARQHGVSLPRMLEIAEGDTLYTQMTVESFKVSEYNIQENKDKASKEFAEEWYLNCLVVVNK